MTRRSAQRWKLLEGGLKARYGVSKGSDVLSTMRTFASTLPHNMDDIAYLVERIYFDPDLAVHLMGRKVADVGSPAWNKKLTRLMALGVASRESSE